ncbi:hypothetical protein [Hyphomicrobium facile]|uniref:Uncharacterized protein n=1 Tax=Hyphomicrobium facile TaxID=51670 RepID=A0A1I7NDH0_9HYPH|nr:hypothetical protein [Hyphomicrobium facile]SFV32710.1 hypothetical protein SAMN04488557_1698 [Hyphomicrobium facile]
MKQAERTVALVAPHFPPSNLAGVHRARLLSQHLHEFGWRPVIVTTHWRHYEEALDWGLASLVDPELEVIRTPALPTKPIRVIGDVGVRALPWHLSALRKLKREKRFDFLYITVPSFYSATLGQLLYREAPIPFGIDYIDPWVHVWPDAEVKYSKAWVSMKLSERLEPWAVRNAALITGVATAYYEGVLERNPNLRETCVTAAMPYGFSTRDFSAPSIMSRAPSLFDPNDGNMHLLYAGALLPKAVGVLERFLEGVALLRERGSLLSNRLRVHFIGTGKSPNDPNGHAVLPVASRLGLGDVVTEHPHRMAYLDVLVHLTGASGVLIVGSTERHYTPSKVFQAVQSRRPVLALLHEASTAVQVLERSRAGMAITLSERRLPEPSQVADALERFASTHYCADSVKWDQFEAYSARESARQVAAAMDEALDRYAREAAQKWSPSFVR